MAINAETRSQIAEAIAQNVKSLRVDRDLTQADLATNIGITRVQLNRIEQGRTLPTAEVLFAMADYFQVPVDHFRRISVGTT